MLCYTKNKLYSMYRTLSVSVEAVTQFLEWGILTREADFIRRAKGQGFIVHAVEERLP